MLCPHCGIEYDENEVVCPDCGRTAYVPKSKRSAPAPAEPADQPVGEAADAEPTGAGKAADFPRPVGVQVKADGTWSVGPDTPAAMTRRAARKRPEILRSDKLFDGKPLPAEIPRGLSQTADPDATPVPGTPLVPVDPDATPMPGTDRPARRRRSPVARDEIPSPDAPAEPEVSTIEAFAPHPDDVPEVSEDAAGAWEEISLPASADEGETGAGAAAGKSDPMSVAEALADSLDEEAPRTDESGPASASEAGEVTPEPQPEAEPEPEPAPVPLAPEPEAEAEPVIPEEEIRIVPVRAAGFWRRLMALAADAVPLLLIAVILYYPITWLVPLPDFPPAREHGIDFLVDLALREPILLLPPGLALVLGFLIYRTALNGRTVGRRLLKLNVVGLDGEAISRPRELVRSLLFLLFGVLFGLGLLWTGFDRERRGLHDKLARTLVAVG